ncbi:MAG TPA: zf-TFIIB domain-containing protein [Rhizorhapis sp.]
MTNSGAGMPCPVCRVPLVMSERQGVEIDYCPNCRGIWLDRGELDKIIERNADQPTPIQQPVNRGYASHEAAHGHGYRKKRKSFLEELFD